MEEIRKCSATLLSPTKIIYIAYVVLLGLKIVPWHSFHVFVALSLVFWIVEVFHSDYLRIVLNKKAE